MSTVALAKWGEDVNADLCELALECEPEEMLLLAKEIRSQAEEAADQLWAILESEHADEERRFRAAQLLANLEGQGTERWKTHIDFVETKLLSTLADDRQQFGPLTSLLQNILTSVNSAPQRLSRRP